MGIPCDDLKYGVELPVATSLNCPEPDSIVDLLHGDMAGLRRKEVQTHLDSCPVCLKAYALLASRQFERNGPGHSDVSGDNQELVPGQSVGRFVVLHSVGRGGMGQVYAVYDPELDRKVALKLMHAAGEAANERLLSEARVLAKSSHPNVISIFDVGRHCGAVYIAMQYIEGPRLAGHFKGAPRGKVIRFFSDAARALSAVHAEGIIHRDLKPSNLLVGPGDRVIVADFGLAGRQEDPGQALVGTPAYMAPEQRAGSPSEASDQYSLCLSLVEVLSGVLPSSNEEIGESLPAPLRRVVARATATKSDERYPDMAAFARALEDTQKSGRGWFAAPLIALGLGAFVLYAFVAGGQEQSAPCQDVEESWGSSWNGDDRRELRERLRAIPGYGEELWEFAERELDTFKVNWMAFRNSSCRATRVLGHQSERELDEESRCLELARLEFAAVLGALASAPDEELASTGDALALLRDPRACAEGGGLGVLPANAERAVSIGKEREKIAGYEVGAALGRLDEAAAGLSGICAQKDARGYAPLRSECSLLLGKVQSKRGELEKAEEELRRAISAGTESRRDHLVAEAWLQLSWLHGYHMEKYEEAERDLENGRAFVKRIGATDFLPVSYSRNAGWFALRLGRVDEAIEHYQTALQLAESQGEQARDLAMLHSDIGGAYLSLGLIDEAAEHLGAGFRQMSEILGARHPDTLSIHNNYALLLKEQGKLDEAIAEFDNARAGFEASLEDSDLFVGQILNNLAVIYSDQEKFEKAEASYLEALSVMGKAYAGGEHANIARAMHGLATVLTERKRYDEAEELHKRSLAMKERLLGAEHPSVAVGLSGLADLYERKGELDEALRTVTRGIEILQAAVGDEHPHTLYLIDQRGEFEKKRSGRL